MAVVDSIMAALPRRVPDRGALQRCRIISHRGEHDNVTVMENTLQAFETARDAGVWGIECDIRWTSDLVPMICHDPSPQRVFGAVTPLSALSFEALRSLQPAIPTLSEVVDNFGRDTHLMLELKQEPWPRPAQQADILQGILEPLAPAEHYHILSLDPQLFERVPFVPAHCRLPVAETNVTAISRYALEHGCAGLGGHYLLLTERLQRRHTAAGQRLGAGFPASKNCLFRELNRGIEWIFSNDAVKLQALRDHYLELAGKK